MSYLDTLKELERQVHNAVVMAGIIPLKPMTDVEKSEFRRKYGDCDMIVGDFKITRIQTEEPSLEVCGRFSRKQAAHLRKRGRSPK